MGISIDSTFAIQIVSFLLLWAVLKRLLFDPMLAVLDERQQRTLGSRDQASQMHADVEAMRADYDRHIRAAREKSLTAIEDSRKLTTAEERTVLGAARDQAAARLTLARVEIAREVDAARVTLRTEATELARELVDKVVGRSVA